MAKAKTKKEKLEVGAPPNVAAKATMLLRKHLDGMLVGLRTVRWSWWQHWTLLATFILPRRYLWLVIPNRMNQGSPINQEIIDNTGTLSAQVLASGMMSGVTNPDSEWFGLTVPDKTLAENAAVKVWCAEVRDRMLYVMAESNYYTAKATQYLDLVVFGTAPMLIYEDDVDIIRCFNPAAGEYYLATDDKFRVNTFYREFTLTVPNVVQQFGLDNCSTNVQTLYRSGGASWRREIKVCHAIEPNVPIWDADDRWIEFEQIPSHFKWREVYWEYGQSVNLLLQASGYFEKVFSAPRWDTLANEAYGRSPGMDALGDIRQLQTMTKREGQAIEKMVNPPLLADVQLKNQPTSALPGGITYAQLAGKDTGMRPVYEVQPRLEEFMKSKQEVQQRIRNAFKEPLFTMISNLDTVRTATEIDARREEKLIQLGPVLERLYNESLDEDVGRIYNIMLRRKLIPMPPQILSGSPIQIEYVSMLVKAQRAASTAAIERLFQVIGNVAPIYPQILDNIDFDEGIEEYADKLGVSPKIVRDILQVMQIRQQRAQAQQQQQAIQATMAGVQAGKLLSETDVGGGQNALSAMLGRQQEAA